MKKVNLYCSLFAVVVGMFVASSARAQSFEQGKFIISGGYGFGNLARAVLKQYQDEAGYKASSLGPLFGKFEYAVSDRVGIGLNVAHIGVGASYQVDNGDGGMATEEFRWNNTSILARVNLHFAKSEKFDAYWGAGLGYRFGSWKWESETIDSNNEIPTVFPFGFETTIGARYYFIKNLGIYAEAGIAKAPIQFGLSAAF
jgi:predicted porin